MTRIEEASKRLNATIAEYRRSEWDTIEELKELEDALLTEMRHFQQVALANDGGG